MFVINSNIYSASITRKLNQATDKLGQVSERLASGMRINRASDDDAGLAIATSLNANSRIFSQGIRNINDGISALNIAGGAISNLSLITDRMLELSNQSANGTYSSSQRRSLNNEVQSLIQEFNRITASTTFNGCRLLDGSMRSLFIQSGGDRLRVGIGQGSSRLVGTGLFDFLGNATFSAGTGSAVFGDLDGDGIQDMVFATGSGSGDIRFALGNGDGTFKEATFYRTGVDNNPFVMGDINGDGIPDIVTHNSSGTFTVSLGNGDGFF